MEVRLSCRASPGDLNNTNKAKEQVYMRMQADIAKVKADGQASAKRALADAELYSQEKQAQAVKAKLTAQARSL